jgi:cytochrome oxidase Cu insertion factor (SCO1/SenC/PrrC family)
VARARFAVAAALCFAVAHAMAHPGEAPVPLAFAPPAPGTYRLPAIQPAPDGEVLDSAGAAHPLSDFTHGRITLLGLVYTRCTDPDGCPRAAWAFNEVRSLLRADPTLGKRVRLVSLSFDPANDVPEVIDRYARRSRGRGSGADWHFLTTVSTDRIAPILEGFGQDLRVAADADASAAPRDFSHTLKVFLIDAQGQVREIYSTAYLMPRMVVNDMRTLDRERRAQSGTQEQKRLRSP